MLPGRVHERYDQEYRGVPVFGGGVARQLDAGQTVSVFGSLITHTALPFTAILISRSGQLRSA